MSLLAGVGRQKITPKVGTLLYGYFDRHEPSQGVHDDLWARAVVLREGDVWLALCSVEVCVFRAREVARLRREVASRCPIPPENIFVFATHSHAAPSGSYNDWEKPLPELVADAIVAAYESVQPATIASGGGFLYGYNINRRWMDRPADPAVGLIRIDTQDGKPLALIGNYACHAVVLGSNNLLISGDWPGYASRLIEQELGVLALFSQGGAGDVNPLTETVRQRLAAGHPVSSIYQLTSYYGYGEIEHPYAWGIEERKNGTFDEAETLARAYKDEALRIWRSLRPTSDAKLWIEKIIVNAALDPDEPPAKGLSDEYRDIVPEVQPGSIPMEIMLFGIQRSVFIGHPGETFSEDSIALRRICQQLGYRYATLITYANGSYAYLPPENAHAEGGYEVEWTYRFGITRRIQDRIRSAIMPILRSHID